MGQNKGRGRKKGRRDLPKLDQDAIFLVDGSSYIFRAFYAIRDLKTSTGIPTNAVYGFTNMLLKVLKEHRPRYLAVVLDASGPTFRHEIFDGYKANRPEMPESLAPQIPVIKEIIEALGIRILEMEGFEADDLIGTMVKRWSREGRQCVIVSGDKDLLQLVSDQVLVLDTMFDRWFDGEAVRERYGVEPSNIPDVLGLMGDASDNVPGVPGIGMKRAVELVRRFGSVEEIVARINEITQDSIKRAIEEHADQALLSKRLVTIDTDVPIPLKPEQLRIGEPERSKLRELFKMLEFHRLLEQWTEMDDQSQRHYRVIAGRDELQELLRSIEDRGILSIQVATGPRGPMVGPLFGLALCTGPREVYYLPLEGAVSKEGARVSEGEAIDEIRIHLEADAVEKRGHDLKRVMIALSRMGIKLKGLGLDTMVASYVINPSRRNHDLDDLSIEFLDEKLPPSSGSPEKGMGIEGHLRRCCAEALASMRISEIFLDRLREGSLEGLFRELEMPLIEVLAEMEMNGVRVDLEMLKSLSTELEYRLQLIQKEIFELAGEEFNIHSHQQLSQILFERLKLPVIKKTKTGFGTDVEVLEELSKTHDLPAKILEYRSLSKLKSTYIDALPKLVNPSTGRIHTTFNQAVAATGRLTSSDPNLQNIPIRGELGKRIRSAFVAEDGWWMFSADYNQVELRILAHLSKDPILVEAFRRRQDVHQRTASEIFGVSPEMVNEQMRRQAKVINFGIIYGMSPYGLSKALGVETKVAQAYIEGYFQRYRGVKDYIEATIEKARRDGYVETLLGRRRNLQEINSSNKAARRFAERVAINTPIQGTAADMIKKAMIKIHSHMKERGLRSRMILQIHDELLFEVPKEEREIMEELVLRDMQEVERLDVPLVVDFGWGRSWAEAH
jgi:DNA polymerase-1